jgi:methylmalonyl-CoA mutase N-terminal domain/subunit
LGGSYFVEALTDEVEAKAQDLIDRIDAMGGAVKAIEEGFIQDEIARSAYAYNSDIENGEKIIVGVNKFQSKDTDETPVFKIDDSIRTVQSEKLASLRARRNPEAAQAAIAAVQEAARNGSNLMPPVIAAVEAYCTLGEIADSLRELWGEYSG